jgi:hypothetical protein
MDSSKAHLYFYLFHFGHLEFDSMFETIINNFETGKTTKACLWKKLSKYVFPEIGSQIKQSTVRSINKKFLKEISNSREFIFEMFLGALDLLLFFGYCWNLSWTGRGKGGNSLNEIDQKGIQMLKRIGHVNRNEINKLFSEWANLIKKQNNLKSEAENMEIIVSSIQRSNFKFPWSFKEIQDGMIYTFLSIVENINFNFLPEYVESMKFYFILTNRISVHRVSRGLL